MQYNEYYCLDFGGMFLICSSLYYHNDIITPVTSKILKHKLNTF